jgi:hypothetical protein
LMIFFLGLLGAASGGAVLGACRPNWGGSAASAGVAAGTWGLWLCLGGAYNKKHTT